MNKEFDTFEEAKIAAIIDAFPSLRIPNATFANQKQSILENIRLPVRSLFDDEAHCYSSNEVQLLVLKGTNLNTLTNDQIVAIQNHFPHRNLFARVVNSSKQQRLTRELCRTLIVELKNLDPRCHVHGRKVRVIHRTESPQEFNRLSNVAGAHQNKDRRNVIVLTDNTVVEVEETHNFDGCADHYFYPKLRRTESSNNSLSSTDPLRELEGALQAWDTAAKASELAESTRRESKAHSQTELQSESRKRIQSAVGPTGEADDLDYASPVFDPRELGVAIVFGGIVAGLVYLPLLFVAAPAVVAPAAAAPAVVAPAAAAPAVVATAAAAPAVVAPAVAAPAVVATAAAAPAVVAPAVATTGIIATGSCGMSIAASEILLPTILLVI
jgi:hypothetical protein